MPSIIGLTGAVAPDPGSPEFGAFTFLIGATSIGMLALALRLPRDEVQWFGFLGGVVGGALGLAAYLFALITDLY